MSDLLRPEVSVVIPAYLSQETLEDCLLSLRGQSHPSFETIVVDSSPDDRCAAIVEKFPEARLIRHPGRLLPHGARNRGAAAARGEILVFTDPDVSFDARWLERLVRRHRQGAAVVSGAIDCRGGRWLDRGVHLCKFSKWLPAGSVRPVDCAPTANLLVSRPLFDALGGFPDDEFLGDLVFSWRAMERGETLWFEPSAAVSHHHLHGIRSFLAERYERGILFAGVRTRWHRERRSVALFYLAVTVLPIRLTRILFLVAGHSIRAGLAWSGRYLATFPVVAAGHAASLAGEALGYARCVLRSRESAAVGEPADTRAFDETERKASGGRG